MILPSVSPVLASSVRLCIAQQFGRILYQASQLKRLSSSLAGNQQQWETKAVKELKGRNPHEALLHHTQDGIPLKPVYTAEDLQQLEGVTDEVGVWETNRQ